MFKPKFDFSQPVYWVSDHTVQRGIVVGITIISYDLRYEESYEVIVPCKYGNEHYYKDVRELLGNKEDAEEILKDEEKEYKRLRIEHLEDTIKKVEDQLTVLKEEKEGLEKAIK